MKKYMLVDLYENYGIVGRYNTFDEMKRDASEWEKETDGECNLTFKIWNEPLNKYVDIIK